LLFRLLVVEVVEEDTVILFRRDLLGRVFLFRGGEVEGEDCEGEGEKSSSMFAFDTIFFFFFFAGAFFGFRFFEHRYI
jgi:hypothetical protein